MEKNPNSSVQHAQSSIIGSKFTFSALSPFYMANASTQPGRSLSFRDTHNFPGLFLTHAVHLPPVFSSHSHGYKLTLPLTHSSASPTCPRSDYPLSACSSSHLFCITGFTSCLFYWTAKSIKGSDHISDISTLVPNPVPCTDFISRRQKLIICSRNSSTLTFNK